MNFCECGYMYFMKISSVDETLMFYCRSCGKSEVPEKKSLVATKVMVERNEKHWQNYVNKYTKYDPTLPYDSSISCPNKECSTNTSSEKDAERKVLHIRYDEENMKYLYLCFHCDYVWNTQSL
jgi:DNA-directed RNA polymerase subunit M/transcription elongation factor TFIIS